MLFSPDCPPRYHRFYAGGSARPKKGSNGNDFALLLQGEPFDFKGVTAIFNTHTRPWDRQKKRPD
jgi:hypothetical protein